MSSKDRKRLQNFTSTRRLSFADAFRGLVPMTSALGGHGSLEARTGLRDSNRGKSSTGHYSMMVGDPKIEYGTPVD